MGLLGWTVQFISENIATILSTIAIILSVYFTYIRAGKLVFPRPNYIAAIKRIKPKNDILIIPMALINTGVRTSVVRVRIVANDDTVFRNNYDYNVIQIDKGNLVGEGHMVGSVPFLIEPRSAGFKNAGFLNNRHALSDYLVSLKKAPKFDVWYTRGTKWHSNKTKWKFAYRLTWNNWLKLKGRYAEGEIG